MQMNNLQLNPDLSDSKMYVRFRYLNNPIAGFQWFEHGFPLVCICSRNVCTTPSMRDLCSHIPSLSEFEEKQPVTSLCIFITITLVTLWVEGRHCCQSMRLWSCNSSWAKIRSLLVCDEAYTRMTQVLLCLYCGKSVLPSGEGGKFSLKWSQGLWSGSLAPLWSCAGVWGTCFILTTGTGIPFREGNTCIKNQVFGAK